MEALAANGAEAVGLSGSGGTVFGVFGTLSEAGRVAKRMAEGPARSSASEPGDAAGGKAGGSAGERSAGESSERESVDRPDPWIRAARVLPESE